MANLGDLWNVLASIYDVIVNGISWLISGISWVLSFIAGMLTFVGNIISLTTNVLGDIFNTNPYAAVVLGIITLGVSAKLTIIVWNIIAELQIAGFKLPKIPL